MAYRIPRPRLRKSDQQAYSGYDYQFVDTIPSKYICSICTKVLRDAHLTVCCGQHFCASCLTHWLGTQQGRKTCPHCRQENFQHVPNKAIIREVNEFKIHCTNHSEGCGWVGELGGLRSHLDSDKGCGYVEVTCTNKGCGEIVSRKDLQTHLQKKCYYRPYECEHCGHKDTYTAITGKRKGLSYFSTYLGCHYKECPEYPLACHNRCGVTGIRRRAMHDHCSSCPLEPLDCPFKDAGCTEKIARKDMEDHMTANQQKHMLLTFQSLQQLQKEREQDKWKLQQLQKEREQDKWKLQQLLEEREQDKWKLQQLQKEREQDKWELQVLKGNIGKEIDSLLENKSGHDKSLSRMKSIIEGTFGEIGDTLTFRVTDFPQLRREKKAWHSPPFSIGDNVRVRLAVYPSGVGGGQGSHVSVSLMLTEVLKKEMDMWLQYNVSVTATGQHRSATPKTLELCTYRRGDYVIFPLFIPACSVRFPFPSPGEVLRSEELFLEIEEANSLLQNDAMILELKLLEHQHHCDW